MQIGEVNDDKLKEACGVLGIYNSCEDAGLGRTAYYGLYALQHRGQESAGIAVTSGNGIKYHKDMGLVSEVFNDEIIDGLCGKIAIGHVRYSTSGSSTLINAQPLVVKYKKGSLAVAHNGNLINAAEVKQELEEQGAVFQTTVDSEVIAFLIAREQSEDISKAAIECAKKIKGSYAIVMMTENELVGMRDPKGIRPLSIGKLNGSYVIASESCAFDTIGAEFIRDVEPGEIVIVNEDGLKSFKFNDDNISSLCIFEFVYFARPDSRIEGKSVHMARMEAGRQLAKESPVEADLVIGVPDSGTVSAMGYAEASGLPFGIGLIKNRYIGRTFIQPSQESRIIGVKLKLNVVKDVIKDKRVVMVDDSIVRGTTSGQIVRLLKESGAKQVHVRVSSPPIMHSCYFGIDTSARKELIGARQKVDEIRQHIGADSLNYLSLEGLIKSTGISEQKFCSGCFCGKYPLEIPMESKEHLFEKR
ncbi:MAG TPA: amidophosphoribosyltransferase [Thermoanaerobacterales bacterium]|nr:amidophosphoribosyltransferase [Thermoanaerobacterales bacterium]